MLLLVEIYSTFACIYPVDITNREWVRMYFPKFLRVVSLTLWQSHGCPSVNEAEYRQVSNISRTLAGYKIADHSDVVGAPSVDAAPTTSSFST